MLTPKSCELLLIFSFTFFVVLISLNSTFAQNDNQLGLYNECVKVSGKSFCDFLLNSNPTEFYQSNNSVKSMGNQSSSLSNTDFVTYRDNDLGFSIEHPFAWEVNNRNSQFSSVVGFSSPVGYAQVDIRVFPQGDYNTIKEYGDENFKEAKDITLLAYYRNSTTLLSEKPAFRSIYLTTYNPSYMEDAFGYKSSTSKAMFTATLVPEKKSVYAIAYFSNSPDFNKYLPTVEKMISSFQIYGEGPIIQEDNSSSSR
jgi:hypothetical protein